MRGPAEAAPEPDSVAVKELAATAIGRLQRSIASLADRIQALTDRYNASQGAMLESVLRLAAELQAAMREDALLARQLASQAAKAREIAAEEARVRAAQLAAYAALLERGGAANASVVAAARTLLSSPRRGGPPGLWASLWTALRCYRRLTLLCAFGLV